jgi:hypothetical protein
MTTEDKTQEDPYTLEMRIEDMLMRHDNPVLPLPKRGLLRDIVIIVEDNRKTQAKRLLDAIEERVIQMNEKPDVQLAPNAFIYSGECEARNNLRTKQREILKELREELENVTKPKDNIQFKHVGPTVHLSYKVAQRIMLEGQVKASDLLKRDYIMDSRTRDMLTRAAEREQLYIKELKETI